jgi:nucleoside-diphosphate kinase
MSNVQRTYSMIKPDAVASGQIGDILAVLEHDGFRIVGMKMRQLSLAEAEGFYGVHRERPFFPDLIRFITEGPVVTLALEREDAVTRLREVMGATNPANAAEGTIRKRFAASIERNCIHGSDSAENAAIELAYFFSEVDLAK